MTRPSILAYKTGDRCPGCGKSQFWIGRITAECHFCKTPLPLADVELAGWTKREAA